MIWQVTAGRDRQVAAPSPAAAAPPAVAVAKEAKAFVADPPEADKTQATQAAGVAGLAESVKRETAEGTRAMPKLDTNVAMQATKSLLAPAGPTIASATATSPPVYATPAAPQAMTAKVSESAEAWMKRILELKRLGKVRKFDDELVKFRKRYPDFALPEELKAAK